MFEAPIIGTTRQGLRSDWPLEESRSLSIRLTLDPALVPSLLSLAAPVLAAFCTNERGDPIRLRLAEQRLRLSIPALPDTLVDDAAELLEELLSQLAGSLMRGDPPALPSFASLVLQRDSEFLVPPPDLNLDRGRRTMIDGVESGRAVRLPLQRALLRAFAFVAPRLASLLPADHYDRLWNLAYGGLALPLDRSTLPPSASVGGLSPADDAVVPPTTPEPTPPPTSPPVTPKPTVPPTVPPSPVPPPRIRSFTIDGHSASTHKSLAGESALLHWLVEGTGPLTVSLRRDHTEFATGLDAVGSRVEAPAGSATYSIRASNRGGTVRREIHLEVVSQPPDPLDPGSSASGFRDVFGPSPAVVFPASVAPGEGYFNVELPGTGGIPDLTRGWRARVYYPATADGHNADFAEGAPFPVVFFAPGRLHNPDSPDIYRGFTYLANHLASRGYAFVSVDLSQVDDYTTLNIDQRAALFQSALTHLLALNSDSSSVFHNRLDFSKVAFGGHSRGGETAILAARHNRAKLPADRLPVGAVFTFAPTDGLAITHSEEPFLLFYGTHDGDLFFGQPIPVYDRTTSQKKQVLINGANHFDWTDDGSLYADTARITRAQTHRFAKGYVTAFLDYWLRGVGGYAFTLRRHAGLGDLDGIDYFGSFEDPDHLVIDDFEAPTGDLSPNKIAQPVTSNGAAFQKRSFPKFVFPHYVLHRTRSLLARHEVGSSPRLEEFLAPRTNYSLYSHLSLRCFQDRSDPLNPPDNTQDFSVELEDSAGQTARVPLSSEFAIPPTDIPVVGAVAFNKCVFATHRLPLRAYVEANPNLNLASLRILRLVFDRTPSSAILIDTISFTH